MSKKSTRARLGGIPLRRAEGDAGRRSAGGLRVGNRTRESIGVERTHGVPQRRKTALTVELLKGVTTEPLRRKMHETIGSQGRWLRSVVMGYFTYHAVPTNSASLAALGAARPQAADRETGSSSSRKFPKAQFPDRPTRRRDHDFDVAPEMAQHLHEPLGREAGPPSVGDPREVGLREPNALGCLSLREPVLANLGVDRVHELRFKQALFGVWQPEIGKYVATPGHEDLAFNDALLHRCWLYAGAA